MYVMRYTDTAKDDNHSRHDIMFGSNRMKIHI